MSQIYVGIDVGLVNLACVKIRVNAELELVDVLDAQCIDLTQLEHNRVPRERCQLHHTHDAYDRIQHFLQEYAEWFSQVDQIRIERQPICGLVHVEQLLFGHFRSIARLISPNAMHKFLGIQHLDYDHRKLFTTRYAEPWLKSLWSGERLHDMADALCLLLFALHQERMERNKLAQQTHQRQSLAVPFETNLSISDFIDQFKYKGTRSAVEFTSCSTNATNLIPPG